MKHRKLRIAWSVAWGIAAVLLIALWARSYWRVDHFIWNSRTKAVSVSIYPGEVSIDWVNDEVFMLLGWSHDGFAISKEDLDTYDEPKKVFGFGWQMDDDQVVAFIPFWFLASASAVIAVVPPPRFKRFGLRSLLIVVTLVAIGLGVIACAVK